MKELIKRKFAFAALILGAMLADVFAAILGVNEVLVVAVLCVCIVMVVIHDIMGRQYDAEPQQEEPLNLDGFFEKGGVAYRWNKGDKEKDKCHSIDELFDGKKTDYVELWLGNKRYFIKEMLETTDAFLHKSEKDDEKFFDNLSKDREI